MLHELLHRFDLPARLLARDGGERALTNLLHLAELLQQAATGLDGEHALIRFLAAQIASPGSGESAEAQLVRLESEAALVKLVTVHKSKGLEYPVVLLPFACGFREVERKGAMRSRGRDGQPRLDLAPDDAAWREAELERRARELERLAVHRIAREPRAAQREALPDEEQPVVAAPPRAPRVAARSCAPGSFPRMSAVVPTSPSLGNRCAMPCAWASGETSVIASVANATL